MTDGVWKGVYPKVFGHSKQLSLNKFFDPSTPSMRKGRDGEKKTGKKNRKKKREKTDENSGHYVIASSRPPERRPLERRTLAPKSLGMSANSKPKGQASARLILVWDLV